MTRTAKAWVTAAVAGPGYLMPGVDNERAASEALGALRAGLVAVQDVC